jgi:hypothetical protein
MNDFKLIYRILKYLQLALDDGGDFLYTEVSKYVKI